MHWAMPETGLWAKSQNDHEPSRAYGEAIYNITRQFPYKQALEIGAAWGISTMAILMAGKGNLLTVDNNGLIKAPAEVKANNLTHRWAWDCVKSEAFFKTNTQTFDLIYIDGSHLYEDVKNDLYEAWQVLNEDGVLIIDDYAHPLNRKNDPANGFSEYGVALACWEFVRDHQITQIDTLGQILYMVKL